MAGSAKNHAPARDAATPDQNPVARLGFDSHRTHPPAPENLHEMSARTTRNGFPGLPADFGLGDDETERSDGSCWEKGTNPPFPSAAGEPNWV